MDQWNHDLKQGNIAWLIPEGFDGKFAYLNRLRICSSRLPIFGSCQSQTLFNYKVGLVRDLNPGPLAPKARIIPLDQRATVDKLS